MILNVKIANQSFAPFSDSYLCINISSLVKKHSVVQKTKQTHGLLIGSISLSANGARQLPKILLPTAGVPLYHSRRAQLR